MPVGKNIKSTAAIFLAAALVATFYIRSGRGGVFGLVLGWIETPWYSASTKIEKTGEIIFSTRAELIEQNALLEEKIKQVALEAVQWQKNDSELDSALALLKYKTETKLDMITARILIKTKDDSNERLVIDKGSGDGIKLGQAVIEGEAILVGVISEVGAKTSRVTPISDRALKLGIRTLNSKGTIGVASGETGSLISVNYIPRTANVKINDVLVTSGADRGVPGGLIVGTVSSIEDNKDKPYLKAYIEPMFDITSLSYVGVASII
ncbi:MAG: rod shape-determining protein MreC [Patescibacteria group bacterium]